MGYKAIRNCSKYKEDVIENKLADEFGEFVYNEMWEAAEILGNVYEKEIKELEADLKLKDSWVKHHQKSVEIAFEKNRKMKEAIEAELKRCGGTVPILSKCLRELN